MYLFWFLKIKFSKRPYTLIMIHILVKNHKFRINVCSCMVCSSYMIHTVDSPRELLSFFDFWFLIDVCIFLMIESNEQGIFVSGISMKCTLLMMGHYLFWYVIFNNVYSFVWRGYATQQHIWSLWTVSGRILQECVGQRHRVLRNGQIQVQDVPREQNDVRHGSQFCTAVYW